MSKAFMDKDFLLTNDTARHLFFDYAQDMPIIDYHCHIDPAQIARNHAFADIAEVWLGGDHYKWRIMRANGAPEEEITGNAPGRVKFQRWAEALPRAIGNPLYHWTHLELQRYFHYNGILGPDTAEEVWQHCNRMLQREQLRVRGIIAQSNVRVLCTTDDPADSLRYHKEIAQDASFQTRVLPAFRPDKAVNINKPEFPAYIRTLAQAAGMPIATLEDLYAALEARIDFFDAMGCCASDHGLDAAVFVPCDAAALAGIFARALAGEIPSAVEADQYKTAMLCFFARQYAKRGWVMQLHYGAIRNTNPPAFARLGPDTGYDCIGTPDCSQALVSLLGALEETGELPKTILYALNPNDNAMLASVAGCFQQGGVRSRVQHGAAWWFNDTKEGMTAQLTTLASLGMLGNFVGMLTDSRSFLSYARHEYFRRILCNLMGTWVENGEYPQDDAQLKALVQDICYHNAARFFGFDKFDK
nr:glucuronate isomerase [Maliibacterium massiliense]